MLIHHQQLRHRPFRCHRLRRQGSDVTIVYLPEEEEDARETKKIIENEGKLCLAISWTTKPAARPSSSTCSNSVNNASKQIMCEDIAEINLDDVESTFRSNVLQIFAVTKYAVPHMEKGRS